MGIFVYLCLAYLGRIIFNRVLEDFIQLVDFELVTLRLGDGFDHPGVDNVVELSCDNLTRNWYFFLLQHIASGLRKLLFYILGSPHKTSQIRVNIINGGIHLDLELV